MSALILSVFLFMTASADDISDIYSNLNFSDNLHVVEQYNPVSLPAGCGDGIARIHVSDTHLYLVDSSTSALFALPHSSDSWQKVADIQTDRPYFQINQLSAEGDHFVLTMPGRALYGKIGAYDFNSNPANIEQIRMFRGGYLATTPLQSLIDQDMLFHHFDGDFTYMKSYIQDPELFKSRWITATQVTFTHTDESILYAYRTMTPVRIHDIGESTALLIDPTNDHAKHLQRINTGNLQKKRGRVVYGIHDKLYLFGDHIVSTNFYNNMMNINVFSKAGTPLRSARLIIDDFFISYDLHVTEHGVFVYFLQGVETNYRLFKSISLFN